MKEFKPFLVRFNYFNNVNIHAFIPSDKQYNYQILDIFKKRAKKIIKPPLYLNFKKRYSNDTK